MPRDSLTSLQAARAAVLERARPLGPQTVGLEAALERRLAEAVSSGEPVPGFDNSAMDGYAVRSADTSGSGGRAASLAVVGESRAGHAAAVALGPGEAIAISTGAMIPERADAVVRLEDTVREGGRSGGTVAELGAGERITIGVEARPGDNIRRAGEDIASGTEVVAAGTRIGPAEQGVLASVGAAEVSCHRRPRVAVLSSGDELIGPDEPMRPGAVRNSNAFTLSALSRESGAEVVSVRVVPDLPAATRDAIEPALSADLVVVCGGVSVGEHDHVKGALADLGVEQVFWRIALKPGKPTWFGRRDDTLVFGLPGNPVSAMVTFLLLVRPALVVLGGGRAGGRQTRASLATDLERSPDRTEAVRCRLEQLPKGWVAHPTGPQGSHILTSMLGADGLALLPPGDGIVHAGQPVEVELIGSG
ncbi:MAG: molybdopterin molybdotransferase MoeA [Solirubrobacterales bacterium]|nr:molybdopterin molybdotransferase MoeA [Solirubrobacterales bacterium]